MNSEPRMSAFRLAGLWSPVILWCGMIFWFSNQPQMTSEPLFGPVADLILRKMAHVTEYFILAAFFWRATHGSFSWERRRHVLAALIFCILYAVSDEFHQTFILNPDGTQARNGNPVDVGIDSIGVAAAVWVFAGLKKLQIPKVSLVILFTAVFLSGCGQDFYWKRAVEARDDGKWELAAKRFDAFAAKFKRKPRSCLALLEEGKIYQEHMQFPMARRAYRRILVDYASCESASEARARYYACADWLPLGEKSSWTEVDSDTGGTLYKKIIKCLGPAGEDGRTYEIEQTIYAPGMTPQKQTMSWVKDEASGIVEKAAGRETIMLKLPAVKGASWRSGQYIYTILDMEARCNTKAGRFDRCLKVQQRAASGDTGSVIDYYAPFVGRVLRCARTAGDATEVPQFELSAYSNTPEW